MNIEIKNFCLIKEANLELNSISLIGAENDTGKSTIGKILFNLFYSVDNYLEYYLELSQEEIKNLFDKISFEGEDTYSELRSFFGFRNGIIENLYNEDRDIKRISKGKQIIHNLKEDLLKNIINFFNKEEKIDLKVINTFKGKYLNKGDNTFTIDEKKNITAIIKEIEEFMKNISKKESLLFIYTMKLFLKEFGKKISNFNSENKKTEILLQEEIYKIQIEFELGEISNYNISNINKIKDIIYIETPLFLDTNDSFENIFRKDLRKKLQNKKNIIETKKTLIFKEEIAKEINDIISGKLYYDEVEKKYKFKRSSEEIQIKSVASGIKSFGILSLLLENNHFTKDTILIIDEPEVHLHPKWQIKYAEILCILAKKTGLKILVNSHSPYFIEAISVYSSSNKYNLSDSVKFYSYDVYEDGNILIDKTNDLGYIYNKLAEPYDILNKEKYNQELEL